MKNDLQLLHEGIMNNPLPKPPKQLIIFVRKTHLSEMFVPTDNFIAWVDGDAAGAMAETPIKALQKLITEQPGSFTL